MTLGNDTREHGADVLEARHDSRSGVRVGPALALAAGVVVLGCALLLIAVTRASGQDSLALFFGGLLVVLVIALAGAVAPALPRRRGRLRIARVEGGVEIIGSPWTERTGVVAAAALAVLLVAMVASALGSNEPFLDAWVPVILMVAFTGGLVWMAWGYIVGRRRADMIQLHRQGFSVCLRGSVEEFSWGDVTGFAVGSGGLTVVLLGHCDAKVPGWAAGLRSDPDLVVELLEFYRAHGRLRGELDSDAVLDRVRQGTFRPAAS